MKILLTIIIFLVSFNANAYTFNNLNEDQLKTGYYKSLKELSDNQKIFIKADTVMCATLEKFDKLKTRVNNGYKLNTNNIKNLGCSYAESTSIGIVVEEKQDYVWMVYKLAYSDNVGWGWFYKGHLMSVSDRKSKHS